MKLALPTASCLVDAVTMVTGIHPAVLYASIGHDGTEQCFNGPEARKGIHIQEVLDAVHLNGYIMFPVQMSPHIAPSREATPRQVFSRQQEMSRIIKYMDQYNCLLILSNHAVAWSKEDRMIFDSRGKVYEFNETLTIREIWCVFKRDSVIMTSSFSQN